jgi:hypothetical protein
VPIHLPSGANGNPLGIEFRGRIACKQESPVCFISRLPHAICNTSLTCTPRTVEPLQQNLPVLGRGLEHSRVLGWTRRPELCSRAFRPGSSRNNAMSSPSGMRQAPPAPWPPSWWVLEGTCSPHVHLGQMSPQDPSQHRAPSHHNQATHMGKQGQSNLLLLTP